MNIRFQDFSWCIWKPPVLMVIWRVQSHHETYHYQVAGCPRHFCSIKKKFRGKTWCLGKFFNCNSCSWLLLNQVSWKNMKKSQVWAHLSTTSVTIMFQKIHEFPGQTNPFLNGWGGWPKCMHVLPNPNGRPLLVITWHSLSIVAGWNRPNFAIAILAK